MSRHLSRKRLAWLALCSLLASLLITPINTAAYADELQTPNNYKDVLFTHGDGSITAASCGSPPSSYVYDPYLVTTFNPSGLVTNNFNADYTPACYGAGAAGFDGTFYAMHSKREGGYLHQWVAAYKNNVRLWAKDFLMCPSQGDQWGRPFGVTIGADGDIYAVIARAMNCGSGADIVTGINANDGSVKFQETLTNNFGNGADWQPIYAYSSGFMVKDGQKLRFFNYNGVESSNSCALTGIIDSCPVQLNGNEQLGTISHDAEGRIFVAASSNRSDLCPSHPLTMRVLHIAANGIGGEFDIRDKCIQGDIKATPSSGIVVHEINSSWGSLNSSRLLMLDSAGVQLTDTSLHTGIAGYNIVNITSAQVDANGNVLVVRTGNKTSGEFDSHVFIDRFDATGVMHAVYSTTANDRPGIRDVFSRASAVALGTDNLYLNLCDTTCSEGTVLPRIYKIADTSIAMDYPRSTVFDIYSSSQGEHRNYVALGDSFSSGQGIPGPNGFISPSNTNGCHRSEKAYSILLDQDPVLDLNLQSFRACSGATTQSLIEGMNGEPGQLDSLSPETDVVTLSIGGNDIDFAGGMTACTLTTDTQVCEDTLSVVNSAAHAPWFRVRLENTYAAVRAAAPNAQVYITGYPEIMGRPNEVHCDWSLLHAMTLPEKVLVDDIGETLNTVIAEEAIQAGFTFVPLAEVFENHTPCSTEPFINGANRSHEEYSYHPNADGAQAIYEKLLTFM